MGSMQGTNNLKHYPSLTDVEFEEGCRALEARCCDNLEGTDWLSVRWRGGELEVKQKGVVGGLGDEGMKVEGGMEVEERGYDGKGDECIESDEDMDAVIRHQPNTDGRHRPAVNFSVVLSPTYRVPVLWLSLSSVKVAQVRDLEEIYSLVVATGSHEALRGTGIMGGISLANHPITDIPTFFVHPCNTPEAMVALNDGSNMDPFRYLLVWFGIVGAGVGLYVPSKVAA